MSGNFTIGRFWLRNTQNQKIYDIISSQEGRQFIEINLIQMDHKHPEFANCKLSVKMAINPISVCYCVTSIKYVYQTAMDCVDQLVDTLNAINAQPSTEEWAEEK